MANNDKNTEEAKSLLPLGNNNNEDVDEKLYLLESAIPKQELQESKTSPMNEKQDESHKKKNSVGGVKEHRLAKNLKAKKKFDIMKNQLKSYAWPTFADVESILEKPCTSAYSLMIRANADKILAKKKLAKTDTKKDASGSLKGDIDEFSEGLKAKNLKIHTCLGDGNCLFRAASVLLYGVEDMHKEIRRQTMLFVTLCWLRFKAFINEPIKTYVKRMSRLGEFGGEPEIYAITECFKRTIEIFPNSIKSFYINDAYLGNGEPLRLHYFDKHYNAIVSTLKPLPNAPQNVNDEDCIEILPKDD